MQMGRLGDRAKLTCPRSQTGTTSNSPDSERPNSLHLLNKNPHTVSTSAGLEWNPVPALRGGPSSKILAIPGPEDRRKQGSMRTTELIGELGVWCDFGKCCRPAPRWQERRTEKAVENSSPPPTYRSSHKASISAGSEQLPIRQLKATRPGNGLGRGPRPTKALDQNEWVWGPDGEWE